MKKCNMNSHTLQDIVRFGAIVLIALVGLVILVEGAKTSQDIKQDTRDDRSEARQIRYLRPHALSTAIGFGKRDSSFRSSGLDRHGSMMFPLQKDIPLKFTVLWFLQYLRNNPELAIKVGRELLSNNIEAGDNDAENFKASVTDRYRKVGDTDDSYYLNK